MKKRSYVIASIITLTVLLGAALYLWVSTGSGSPVEALDKRITTTPPGAEDRKATLLAFDDFIENNFPTAVTPKTQATELLELRTRRAIEEIRNTVVPEGSMKVWYIYNMGVVVKTSNVTVGIDVAGTYEAASIAEVGDLLDVLIVTHPHGDHLDPSVAAAAARNGAKIIMADEKVRVDDTGNVVRDPTGESMIKILAKSDLAKEALVGVEPGGTIEVKGIKITAYPAEHSTSGEAEDTYSATPTDWFYVETSGFGILHTGDGFFNGDKPDFSGKRVDVYLTHYIDGMYAEEYYKLVPQSRVMIPLHLHELGHGRDIFTYAMFRNALEQEKDGYLWLENATPQKTGTRYTPMIWGESMSLGL